MDRVGVVKEITPQNISQVPHHFHPEGSQRGSSCPTRQTVSPEQTMIRREASGRCLPVLLVCLTPIWTAGTNKGRSIRRK